MLYLTFIMWKDLMNCDLRRDQAATNDQCHVVEPQLTRELDTFTRDFGEQLVLELIIVEKTMMSFATAFAFPPGGRRTFPFFEVGCSLLCT